MKCASLCWTFRLDWTSPDCGGIKNSTDSCRCLNAHHTSMFWPTKGDTEILARDKEPWSHLQLSFCMSIRNPDRSHLKSMIRDEYPLQWFPLGCSSFKKAHRRGTVYQGSASGFQAMYFGFPNLPKGEIRGILWRYGMTRPDNLCIWTGGLHSNKTKIDLELNDEIIYFNQCNIFSHHKCAFYTMCRIW